MVTLLGIGEGFVLAQDQRYFFVFGKVSFSDLAHLQNNCTKMGDSNRDFSKNGQTF